MDISGGTRRAVAAVLLLVLATGCGSTAADRQTGTGNGQSPPPTGSPVAVAFCPPSEAGPAPTPCIPAGEAQRYAENHAHRQEMPLSASAAAENGRRAEALVAALRRLAAAALTEDGLRDATAAATGVEPAAVHVEMGGDDRSARVVVEVGGGCVTGDVHNGEADAGSTGALADGGCVPAVGH
ncbi:precorrin-3B C(17)-methyltransferase [Kitasatospora sp. NPDC088346]|uniref:precorrin-3B C(17)-methyltransferase n=1 Tax=Kitasatospora sp. NPDC088346 TaxID=3364073 RepID=UPI0038212B2B